VTGPRSARTSLIVNSDDDGIGGEIVILARLDAHDRALFSRLAIADAARHWRLGWTLLTHLGGVWFAIAAATIPLAVHGAVGEAAERALATLVVSHLVVQLIKRTVGRPRPSRATGLSALAVEPDRFSFPSGHAAAAMSIAFVYACAFSALALPLLLAAAAVGLSRVRLGVHYPGDVLAGQLLAVVTGLLVMTM
jgi:undecaprenyl-diphosphatase